MSCRSGEDRRGVPRPQGGNDDVKALANSEGRLLSSSPPPPSPSSPSSLFAVAR